MAAIASVPDGAAGGRRALRRVGLIGAALLATAFAGPAVHLRLGDLAFAALAVAQGLLVLLATRLAAGCRERQGLALQVANSLFLGDYLTSEGQAAETDLELIRDHGFVVLGSEDDVTEGDHHGTAIRRRGAGTAAPANA